jgi:hypothetical protein
MKESSIRLRQQTTNEKDQGRSGVVNNMDEDAGYQGHLSTNRDRSGGSSRPSIRTRGTAPRFEKKKEFFA